MLEKLRIENFAIIDSLEVDFSGGLNVVTGETGAGKSILVGAISMVLGGRGSSHLVRSGKSKASVEALFDLKDRPDVLERLQEFDLVDDEDAEKELLIRRSLYQTGKNRIWINGCLSNLSVLKKIGMGLVDLCGQHEHQSLMSGPYQLALLDRYASCESASKEYRDLFKNYVDLKKKRETLEEERARRDQEVDFLRFQKKEIEETSPEEGEDERLETQKKKMMSQEELSELSQMIEAQLYSNEDSVITQLGQLKNRMSSLIKSDEDLEEPFNQVQEAIGLLEEVSYFFRNYQDRIEHDSVALDELVQRLEKITKLKRKFGGSLSDVFSSLEKIEEKLSRLENAEEHLESLEKEVNEVFEELIEKAQSLSKKRIKAAQDMAKRITLQLHELHMEGAQFKVQVEKREELSSEGFDRVAYLISPNSGEPLYPIKKIASGGELSRITLAIRRMVSQKGGIGVYLFDEIDAGIGGQTGLQVGRKLHDVARNNQVICITHLPQVAAFADHHLSVSKAQGGKRTVSRVKILEGETRELELARMLGGGSKSKTTRAHARELLEMRP
jgi:DNA repair protein RecN (Recombination protein N)